MLDEIVASASKEGLDTIGEETAALLSFSDREATRGSIAEVTRYNFIRDFLGRRKASLEKQ